MRDPHTKESRGFGFVNMASYEDADKAKEALQGEVIEGRTLSIEKARRAKPRGPTPGRYYGPPKREYPLPPSFAWTRTDSLKVMTSAVGAVVVAAEASAIASATTVVAMEDVVTTPTATVDLVMDVTAATTIAMMTAIEATVGAVVVEIVAEIAMTTATEAMAAMIEMATVVDAVVVEGVTMTVVARPAIPMLAAKVHLLHTTGRLRLQLAMIVMHLARCLRSPLI